MRSRLKLAVAFVLCALCVAAAAPRPHATPPPVPSASFPNPEPIQVELLKRSEGIKWRQTLLWHESVEALKQQELERQTQTEPRGPAQHMAHYEPGSIEQLICSVFGENCARAIRIATCESNLNPAARNPSGASGLFQLLGHGDMFEAHGWSADDWSDPYKNTVVAFDLSRGGTYWAPWVCK